jgi:hypothetical protein
MRFIFHQKESLYSLAALFTTHALFPNPRMHTIVRYVFIYYCVNVFFSTNALVTNGRMRFYSYGCACFISIRCDICSHSVVVKFTETSPCTLRRCVSKGARVFSNRNACFKYACPYFFLHRSLPILRIRMFWYACTFMKPTYPIDCTHMGIFSLRSGVPFNANACLKCPPTSYFCPFRMYCR